MVKIEKEIKKLESTWKVANKKDKVPRKKKVKGR